MTIHDFPRGFAEHDDQPRSLMFHLEYGQVYDVGLAHYGEFFASHEYARDLLKRDTVLLDGQKGSCRVVHRFTNGVQLSWKPKGRRTA